MTAGSPASCRWSAALGWRLRQFLPSFVFLYVISLLIFTLGQWNQADHYNLEPPLVALLLGLLIANTKLLSIVATTRWESTGVDRKPDAGEIWRRFPKFVVGFLLASLLITWVTASASYAQFKSSFTPELVGPIKNFRTWAFIFCFLSIGLTTRLRELATAGWKPFWAFSAGVAVNVVLGFVLSVLVFYTYWSHL